jgi:predicted dithiol-disulfide oxidoreductase (DUF899 family)
MNDVGTSAEEVAVDDVAPMWPVGSSREYVEARLRIARAERDLRDRIEAVAAARRQLPAGALLADYTFDDGQAGVRLIDLFGAHDTLLIYHLMFDPDDDAACPMCSMWVDGLHGVAHHLARHTSFVVVGKAPIDRLQGWVHRRGWDGLRILSSHGTTFNVDMHAERATGAQRPMMSVLTRESTEDGERARHFYSLPADFLDGTPRGFDTLNPVWQVLDMLPAGRGEWYPDNDYPGRGRG